MLFKHIFKKQPNTITKSYFSDDIPSNSINIPTNLKKKFFKEVTILEVSLPSSIPKDQTNPLIFPRFSKISQPINKYYQILLDNKKCKSFYLDELHIPNKRLALLMAEEWASQKEYINMYSMHFNLYASSGTRMAKHTNLQAETVHSLSRYIQTDQLCYLEKKIIDFISEEEKEDLTYLSHYIVDYMRINFNITLNLDLGSDYMINGSVQEQEANKMKSIITDFDPWVISLLEILTGMTKSLSVSLALLDSKLTPRQVYLLTNSEEFYQMKRFGLVEGHHDITYHMIMAKLYSIYNFSNILHI